MKQLLGGKKAPGAVPNQRKMWVALWDLVGGLWYMTWQGLWTVVWNSYKRQANVRGSLKASYQTHESRQSLKTWRCWSLSSWEIWHKRAKTTHEGPGVNSNVSAISTSKGSTQCHLQDILDRRGQLAWKSPNPSSNDDLIQLHGLVVPTEKPCWPQLGALQVFLSPLMPHKQQVQSVTSYTLLNLHTDTLKLPDSWAGKRFLPRRPSSSRKYWEAWQDKKPYAGAPF